MRTSEMLPRKATFWQRFAAALIDSFAVLAVFAPIIWLRTRFPEWNEVLLLLCGVLSFSYEIVAHAKFGKTLGKHVMGARVVRLDYTSIGWKEAWLRSSVSVAFFVVESFLAGVEAAEMWTDTISILSQLWVWSEVIVMLCNEQRRALHDFIAGTLVIDERHAPTRLTTV